MNTNLTELTEGKQAGDHLTQRATSLFFTSTSQSPGSERQWLLLVHFPMSAPNSTIRTPVSKPKVGATLCRKMSSFIVIWKCWGELRDAFSSYVEARQGTNHYPANDGHILQSLCSRQTVISLNKNEIKMPGTLGYSYLLSATGLRAQKHWLFLAKAYTNPDAESYRISEGTPLYWKDKHSMHNFKGWVSIFRTKKKSMHLQHCLLHSLEMPRGKELTCLTLTNALVDGVLPISLP